MVKYTFFRFQLILHLSWTLILVGLETLGKVEMLPLWGFMEGSCYLGCLVVLGGKMEGGMGAMDTVGVVVEELMASHQGLEELMEEMVSILLSLVKEVEAVV